jgi:hypothetical protein
MEEEASSSPCTMATIPLRNSHGFAISVLKPQLGAKKFAAAVRKKPYTTRKTATKARNVA